MRSSSEEVTSGRLIRATGLAVALVALGALFVAFSSQDDEEPGADRFVRTSAARQVEAPGRVPRDPPARQLAVGDEAPMLSLPELAGGMTSLAEHDGRVVVLNVWGSWCPPCIQEMPSLEALHDSAPEKVRVITVSVDDVRSDAERIVERLGLTLPVWWDRGGDRLAAWGTVKYPETWIIDPDGRVVERIVGARDWADPQLLRRLVALAG